MNTTEQPTTRAVKRPSLSAADALDILTSALGYCQTAGLEVELTNTDEGLRISIPRAAVGEGGDQLVFVC